MNFLESNLKKLNVMDAGCSVCGSTIDDIITTGKLGCPRCYEDHKEQIATNLPLLHFGGRTHKGKSPKKLEDLLEKAVKQERYEDAAVLRDRIKERIERSNLEPPEVGVKEDLV